MSNETERNNIVHHLLNKAKDAMREIETHEIRIRSSEQTIKESKMALLKYHAERQALLERATDFGWNPETDVVT